MTTKLKPGDVVKSYNENNEIEITTFKEDHYEDCFELATKEDLCMALIDTADKISDMTKELLYLQNLYKQFKE